MAFPVPDSYEPRATRYWVDESGQKWRSMGNICWYTNLDHKKRHEELDLYKTYSPEEYPKYDNYDAIEVSRVADIPMDYEGYMGVPITFLDKYNPDQFEIYGATESEGNGFSNGLWNSQSTVRQPVMGGGTALQANIHQTQESLDCSMTQEIQRSMVRANTQESLFATSILGMIKNAEGKINGKITYARIIIRKKRNAI